jgi:hypothetical protein
MPIISLIEVLKVIILASVLFVWIVRYDNIILEFTQYNLPAWLRDLVGILKIASVIMIFNQDSWLVLIGSGTIVFLMLSALFTHIRINNPISKMLPSFTLMSFSLIIFLSTL